MGASLAGPEMLTMKVGCPSVAQGPWAAEEERMFAAAECFEIPCCSDSETV